MPSEHLDYVWFADRYHWTPDEVDDVPAYLIDWYPAIEAVLNRVRKPKK